MNVDRMPSQSSLLDGLQALSVETAGYSDARVHIGLVDTQIAEGFIQGFRSGPGRQTRQLMGILVAGEQIVASVTIPVSVGRTDEDNDINWQARFQYVQSQLTGLGYVVNYT